MLFKLLQLTDD